MDRVREAARHLARRSVAARRRKWGAEGFRERMRAWGKLGGRPRGEKGESMRRAGLVAALLVGTLGLCSGCRLWRTNESAGRHRYVTQKVDCAKSVHRGENEALALLDTKTGQVWVYTTGAFIPAQALGGLGQDIGHDYVLAGAPSSFPYAGAILLEQQTGRMWGLTCASGTPELLYLPEDLVPWNKSRGEKRP